MFFTLSKIFWFLANPVTLLMVLLVVSLAVLLFGSQRMRDVCRPAAIAVMTIALVLMVFPIGDWLLHPWEQKLHAPEKMPATVDGIIILGGAIDPVLSEENKQITLHEAAERLTALPALAHRYPKAKIVFTSGSGDIRNPDMKEADYAKILFDQWRIKNVTFERQSRNTFENALFSADMVKPKSAQTWLLVTSADHMPRAHAIFKKQGWDITPYPVDYKALKSPPVLCFCIGGNLGKLDTLFHEWVGILAYRMTGKI